MSRRPWWQGPWQFDRQRQVWTRKHLVVDPRCYIYGVYTETAEVAL